MEHCSWKGSKFNFDELKTLQSICKENPSVFAEEYQHGLVPVYNASNIDINSPEVQMDIYNTFFEKSGCLIVKNVYSKELMDKYNKWCEVTLETAKASINFTIIRT